MDTAKNNGTNIIRSKVPEITMFFGLSRFYVQLLAKLFRIL